MSWHVRGMGKRGAFFIAVILLAGCERDEPTPAAFAPRAAPETLEPAPDHYVDTRHGFAIAVPDGWRARGAETVFAPDGLDAELRVVVTRQGVDSVRDGVDVQGYMVRTRRLRARNGAVVSATMRYRHAPPSLDALAVRTLATLQPLSA